MINYETANYDLIGNSFNYSTQSHGRNAHCGTMLHESISTTEIIGNKNGIVLKAITRNTKVCYELYMDGDLLNKFDNLKIAKAMFKDFSA